MSNAYNTSGTTLGNQRIGSTAVKAGRRPIARNVIDGTAGSPLNDGDYPGDLIVGVSDISDLYNNRFLSYASSSSSGNDILWNHTVTGNIISNGGAYNIGSTSVPFGTGHFNVVSGQKILTAPPYNVHTNGFVSRIDGVSSLYWLSENWLGFKINTNNVIGIDGYAMSSTIAYGLGASILNPDIMMSRLSTRHMLLGGSLLSAAQLNLPTNLSIQNRHTSSNVGEWLNAGFSNETGYIRTLASGTGIPRPLRLEAGSGTHRATLGLTTANSGQITYGVSPLSGPSGLARIPIIISGVQYYLLASTS